MKTTYIIGMGMGGTTLTRDAAKAVEDADILIGAKRMLDMAELAEHKEKICEYSPDKIAGIISSTDKTCAVLMSGDTGFFSGAEKLRRLIPDAVVLPG
ncbi:MAG: bifunctional cobalt-precorrin-7 (C(5))-methyltransferase/cobalt-precorrin-6B (C(15))-methyltransferase, partial [Oscillospiraceae bacterium]|nr:bifunctional cobalt-precorrin-7 (C(5))-methyltransferase/cobalt-precorrin-6B (C(15))-methyltransferase [Oscillospiraceae bacterium]